MAQAVFDEHPLEEYLRDVGEAPQIMPGGASEFAFEANERDMRYEEDEEDLEWLPSFVTGALDHIHSILSSAQISRNSSIFAERFKYDVISSSLLSSTFSTSHPGGRDPRSPVFPGRLSSDHSRTGSLENSQTSDPAPPDHDHPTPPSPAAEPFHYSPTTLVLVVAVAILSAGYIISGISLLGGTLYYAHAYRMETGPKPDVMTSVRAALLMAYLPKPQDHIDFVEKSLETLNDLISAGNVWESVVYEAITILESEERSIFYGPTTPSSPSSSLRVALQSSLHTTQNQSDNVRQLFSALTSPAELSQLSEMYAPPSPMKPSFDVFDSPRPRSLPGSARQRTISVPTDNKRSTWNGSYAALALAGSPTMQILKRREKRRSDLSALLESPVSRPSSVSAPTTPLDGVQEEEEFNNTQPFPTAGDDGLPQFGVSALQLKRKQRNTGLEALGMPPPPSYSSSMSPLPSRASIHTSSSMSSASRFTMMQTTRHPLSLSALHYALQGALASKRYACSHLLALRFEEEDDESYWEDVRSVMELLTSTFVDASSRLTEALDDAEKKRLKDENPSPSLPSESRAVSPPLQRAARTMSQMVSFAPMPSHLSRFAAHVDAISSALNDARENLEQCVASLREEPDDPALPSQGQDTAPALQAYERLRRELGLALRECERGRERLLDVLAPSEPVIEADDGDMDDLPALGHDVGSDESDKPDSASPILDFHQSNDNDTPVKFTVVPSAVPDDATSHLLLTATSQHLPPPGIEQVFETESEGVSFTRERSKLTREERIRLMKARRESGGGIGLGLNLPSDPPIAKPARGGWGPGGEVVQELKDVIWQVGEKRRKMAEGRLRNVSFSTDALEIASQGSTSPL